MSPLVSQQGSAPAEVPPAGSIEQVTIVADVAKGEVREFLGELRPWLASRARDVAVRELSEFAASREEPNGDPTGARPDLAVVLGGDGAMLAAVRAFRAAPVPTLGINFGRVGFLAATPVSHWRETLSGILAGEGVVEARMRIAFTVESRDGTVSRPGVALNDAVVNRGAHQRMLTVSLGVGDTWVTDYRADGLIIATPSGSTGYSLSAGGPILLPSMEALVVTPISPQGLAARPIVLDPETRLSVEVSFASGITTLVVDGQSYYPLQVGDRVVVERHPVPYPLLAMPELDPYRRLRERLGWAYNVGNQRR